MIYLPTTVRNRPTFRILKMQEGQWTTQSWSVLPVPAIYDRTSATPATRMSGTVAQGGYHLESISRWCLPDEDRAQFYIDTGTINGVEVTAIELSNYAIRIQVLDDETFPNGVATLPAGSGSKWKTVFAGTVIYQGNTEQPGQSSCGRTTYYCAGVLSRTRNWPLDRHATLDCPYAKGHPGYNIPLHGLFRKVLGNRDSSATSNLGVDPYGDMTADLQSYFKFHALPLDSSAKVDTWTDASVISHALVSSRARGEPLIQVALPSDLFGGFFAWDVSPGDSCLDMLNRICDRRRGRGSVFLDYQDASDPGGDLTLILKSYSPFINNVPYFTVGSYGDMNLSSPNIISSATLGVGAVNVDINGDHRVSDDFQYDNRYSSVVDCLTIQGEPIQVLCNLNFFGGSLSPRWSKADQASFKAIPAVQTRTRTYPRWRHVWRRYGVPMLATSDWGSAWNFQVTPAPGGSAASINYVCDFDGTILTKNAGDNDASSSLSIRVMPDLPIYEGWRYDAVQPVRYDAGSDYLPPDRMLPQVLYRADTDVNGSPAWFSLMQVGFGLSVDDFGMLITHPNEDNLGIRYLANTTDAPNAYQSIGAAGVTTVSGLNQAKLNTIIGVELGTRVSMMYGITDLGSYKAAGRRLTLTINGLHLWLGAPGSIWEFDQIVAAQDGYQPGLTLPAGSNPAVLRDDRNALSFMAALAWQYFGIVHNPGTWSLKDCGFMTSFAIVGGTKTYPTLGQLVGTVTYQGTPGNETKTTLNTPITSIHYDHGQGVTTWRTDYVQFDGNLQ